MPGRGLPPGKGGLVSRRKWASVTSERTQQDQISGDLPGPERRLSKPIFNFIKHFRSANGRCSLGRCHDLSFAGECGREGMGHWRNSRPPKFNFYVLLAQY
jgi:hypothetical protein